MKAKRFLRRKRATLVAALMLLSATGEAAPDIVNEPFGTTPGTPEFDEPLVEVDIPLEKKEKQPAETPQPTEQPAKTPQPTEQPAKTPQPTEQPAETPQPTEQPVETPRPTEQPADISEVEVVDPNQSVIKQQQPVDTQQ
ncbi:MAG: hypothetical protein IJG33_10810, partial [Selenomonadaceae bacterium]|nr:hypothetical protein [Selenomonadaceae bacterium]